MRIFFLGFDPNNQEFRSGVNRANGVGVTATHPLARILNIYVYSVYSIIRNWIEPMTRRWLTSDKNKTEKSAVDLKTCMWFPPCTTCTCLTDDECLIKKTGSQFMLFIRYTHMDSLACASSTAWSFRIVFDRKSWCFLFKNGPNPSDCKKNNNKIIHLTCFTKVQGKAL